MVKIVCIHTANVTDRLINTGIVDYTALMAALQGKGDQIAGLFMSDAASADLRIPDAWPGYDDHLSAEESMRQFPQEEFQTMVGAAAMCEKALPVLVVNMGERTGFRLSPETLHNYPVVAVSHEFMRLDGERRILRLRQFCAADQILFTNEEERDAALTAMRDVFGDARAASMAQKISVYPVPSNIVPPARLAEPTDRAPNVVVFGVIKARKGLEKVPLMAQQIKDDPTLTGRKIILMGSVPTHGGEDGQDGGSILRDLLPQVFGPQEGLAGKSDADLVVLALQLERSVRLEDRLLPIELRLNEPMEEVSHVLSQNRYCFLPLPRGATGHSGTLAAALEHHMITFIARNPDGLTPDILQNGCVYLPDRPEDFVVTMKRHEKEQARNPRMETAMVAAGDPYRDAIGWPGLIRLVNGMARKAVALHYGNQAIADATCAADCAL
ncbi:MAG: hypothetical protein JO126_07985 [Alphaproteobacteria bacterium]|nr:hypothetical protein [Alphaproteobacteria bacterium]